MIVTGDNVADDVATEGSQPAEVSTQSPEHAKTILG